MVLPLFFKSGVYILGDKHSSSIAGSLLGPMFGLNASQLHIRQLKDISFCVCVQIFSHCKTQQATAGASHAYPLQRFI